MAQSTGTSRFMPFPRTFALSEHKYPQPETEIGVAISVSLVKSQYQDLAQNIWRLKRVQGEVDSCLS